MFQDLAVHDWYRFILSYPPHLVRQYLDRFSMNSNSQVLDPFCGTGTTLVECKKLGIPSIGIEANPMAWFASRVKTEWEIDPEGLLDHANKVAFVASEQLENQGLGDMDDLPLFRSSPPIGCLKTLPTHKIKLILRNSISPLPLHKTLTLLETMEKFEDLKYSKYERLALAKALVFRIGNLEFGPEVGVGKSKADYPVITSWMQQIKTIYNDLLLLKDSPKTVTTVFKGDSRRIKNIIKPQSIDAVITSPPYPNEKDYTRTTRLESVLLGFISNKEELRELKRALLRSNTRGVYKHDTDDVYVSNHSEINRIANQIEERRLELGKTSGFERLYSRVTKLYFGGMFHHLSDLRDTLRPGARLAYVVGDQASYLKVLIRTGQLLADIAQSLGYELESIDLFRTRLATATREQLREEVVVLRWPGGK